MRIAITSQNLDPKIVVSGISTVVQKIISLSKEEHFLFEVGYRDGDKKNIRWFFKQIYLFAKFPFFLKQNNIDLVHINIPFNAFGIIRDYILLRIAKTCNTKVLLHIHGGSLLMVPAKNFVLRYLIKKLLTKSDKVLVLSGVEKETICKNYGFNDIEYIENAVDISEIKFNPRVLISDKTLQQITFLYMGRITEDKGIDVILTALQLLYLSCNFKFILCGSGIEAIQFANKFSEFMGNDFIFKGVVSGNEKWNTIYESDIFLLPSRHSEGLPMALLETMASGVVPVVTEDGSMKTVVTNGHNGLIVKKEDGVNLAKELHKLILNQNVLKKYSVAARETIEAGYDDRVFIRKMDIVYNSIIS